MTTYAVALKENPDLRKVVEDVATDLASLKTTVNAIITAAATNIGAVAAVTPVGVLLVQVHP